MSTCKKWKLVFCCFFFSFCSSTAWSRIHLLHRLWLVTNDWNETGLAFLLHVKEAIWHTWFTVTTQPWPSSSQAKKKMCVHIIIRHLIWNCWCSNAHSSLLSLTSCSLVDRATLCEPQRQLGRNEGMPCKQPLSLSLLLFSSLCLCLSFCHCLSVELLYLYTAFNWTGQHLICTMLDSLDKHIKSLFLHLSGQSRKWSSPMAAWLAVRMSSCMSVVSQDGGSQNARLCPSSGLLLPGPD